MDVEDDDLAPFGISKEILLEKVKKMKLANHYNIEIETEKSRLNMGWLQTWKNGTATLHSLDGDFKRPVLTLTEEGSSVSEKIILLEFVDMVEPKKKRPGRDHCIRINLAANLFIPPVSENVIISFPSNETKIKFLYDYWYAGRCKHISELNPQELIEVGGGHDPAKGQIYEIAAGERTKAFEAAAKIAEEQGQQWTAREVQAIMIQHKYEAVEEAETEAARREAARREAAGREVVEAAIAAPRNYAVAHGEKTLGDALRADAHGGGKKKKKKSKKRSKKRRNTKRKKSKKRKSKKRKSKTRRKRR